MLFNMSLHVVINLLRVWGIVKAIWQFSLNDIEINLLDTELISEEERCNNEEDSYFR